MSTLEYRLGPLLPGLDLKAAKKSETVGYGPLGHYHGVAAMCRVEFEKDAVACARGKYPGKWIFVGASPREKKLFAEGDHCCRTLECWHDVSHDLGQCGSYKTCLEQASVMYACDFLYYQTPGQWAELMAMHGVSVALANIMVPFVGGCGERFAGDVTWERVGKDRVRVVTDQVTRDCWEHSDMCWLLERKSVRTPHGTLVWHVEQAGAERALYAFRLVDSAVADVAVEIPSLRGWLTGGMRPWSEHMGNPICYNAEQVAHALGKPKVPFGGTIVVKQVLELQNWLAKNPQRKELWHNIACQRAGNMGVKDVALTAMVAEYLADQHQSWSARTGWWWQRAENVLWYNQSRDAATRLIGLIPQWVGVAIALLVVATIFGFETACILLLVRLGALYLPASRYTPVKGVEYRGYDLVETCLPTVGEYETERGRMKVDDCHCSPKPAYSLAGISVLPESLTTSCGCPKTLGTAFARRVLDVEFENFDRIAPNTIAAIEKAHGLLGLVGVLHGRRPGFQQWVERGNFDERSRNRLRQARAQGPNQLVTGHASAFVKKEIIIKPDPDMDGDAAPHKPRMIQPVDMDRRAFVGPYVYGVTDAIKFIFAKSAPVWFASGATGEQLGEWLDEEITRIGEVAFIKADYSCYDGTSLPQGGQALGLGVKAMVGYPEDVAHLDFVNRYATEASFGFRDKYGGADCRVKQHHPTVASGHDDTTCGNSTANAMVHHLTLDATFPEYRVGNFRTYEPPADWVPMDPVGFNGKNEVVTRVYKAALKTNSSPEWQGDGASSFDIIDRQYPAASAVMGDDGKVVCRADSVAAYLRNFTEASESFGFKPEAEIVYDLCELEFCSSLPWPSADGTVYGPKIGRIMAKTGFKRTGEGGAWAGQLRGDAMGLLASCNHVPILRVWVARLLALTAGAKLRADPKQAYKIRAAKPHAITEASWDFAARRYGLERSVLEELEQQVASVEKLPAILRHPAWVAIVKKDA